MLDDVFYMDVKLKTGETVRVSIDELKEFLDKNRDQVIVQHKKMGKRRISAPLVS